MVQVVLAGTAYMIAHMLNIAVGLTFSGGFLDFFLFGILQGNEKTGWMRVIPVGILYFFLYYFIFKFLIRRFDFKTPGREDEDTGTKLYTKADVNARRTAEKAVESGKAGSADPVSETITLGLGGKQNISDVDCCATRLRCTVHDAELVNDVLLKSTGASGVVRRGNGVQIIYGPQVTVIKSNLEDYLEKQIVSSILISSPIKGIAAPLSTAPDEAFAEGMMGDGAVVTPMDPIVRAPEDGEVNFVFDTKHAIGFQTDSGFSILIHIGIDTVKLEGKGFEVFVENGQKVKKGEPMLKLNLEYIKAHAPSLASPVLCTELEKNQKIRLLKEGEIQAGEALFAIDTLEDTR
jgi:PTS system D-glucosamine-specific IIC component